MRFSCTGRAVAEKLRGSGRSAENAGFEYRMHACPGSKRTPRAPAGDRRTRCRPGIGGPVTSAEACDVRNRADRPPGRAAPHPVVLEPGR